MALDIVGETNYLLLNILITTTELQNSKDKKRISVECEDGSME
jgi:hypothetical protein